MTVEVTLGIRRCEQLATIFRAVASANRLSETLAKAYQPHHTIASQLAATLGRMNQAQFTGLNTNVALASQKLAKAYQPHHTIASQLAATLARNEPGAVRQLAMGLSRPVYRTERELGQGLLATPPSH
jgi:hypothetical protein